VAMLYMYSLVRYLLEFACCSRVTSLNVSVLCHIVSIGVLARGCCEPNHGPTCVVES
jgi:hypothetical protein